MIICEVFQAACEFAMSRGAERLRDQSGTWDSDVDDKWWISINAHAQDAECSRGLNVPPCSVYVEFNGWPAGVIDAAGGCIAAGKIANEEAFVTALRQHTPRSG